MKNRSNRRTFIKLSALSSSLLGLSSFKNYDKLLIQEKLDEMVQAPKSNGETIMNLKVPPIEQVRIGLIGLGNRGFTHMFHLIDLFPKAKITAICDIRKKRTELILDRLKKAKLPKPKVYSGAEDSWKKMLKKGNLDFVIISTPWENHAEMSIYAMEHGIHVGIEIPAALTIQDQWKMIDVAEATQRNCMMLENVCYGKEEMWLLNMINEGVFGTLTYAEGAYIHDLKSRLFNGMYRNWRIKHHMRQDGNLYPTHGLGPIAQYFNINRGDGFKHLVSMSSLESSLSEFTQTLDENNQYYNQKGFVHGDMNNTLIKTEKGRTILIKHDVVTPRPYTRINALAGTKAYHEGFPSRLSLIEKNKGHKWLEAEELKEMRTKYKPAIWERLLDYAPKYNEERNDFDFAQLFRIISCFNKGLPLDMDVYDGMSISAVVPLSKLSVELGNIPIQFPDFTRGKWKEERPHGILTNL